VVTRVTAVPGYSPAPPGTAAATTPPPTSGYGPKPKAADPAILDEIPYAGDIIPARPPALKARLFAASDLNILWNKQDWQATVTVTDDTLAALPEILDPDQPGYHDTAAAPQTMGYQRVPLQPYRWHNHRACLP
jgi:hypothetical protein